MNLISSVLVKNFKCFRTKTTINLSQGTYLIGINNAGKTAILNAVSFFFNDTQYHDESFLNRTEYLAKKAGYNQAEITLHFNLEGITSKELRTRLVRLFSGKKAEIAKLITFTPSSGKISFNYKILNETFASLESLNPDIKKLLTSVKVTYIHPQEGKELLINAQEKLRQRLLANWGRNPRLSRSINDLQLKWGELRKQARTYLSASLTESLQKMWPGSEAVIDLPKNIKEIVAISDISFRGHQTLPEVELTSQGTGAQSTILYHAHFLLDSDRSLHRGEYHSIWLLEEPESFLHGDLAIKFAQELNSPIWLNDIQMIVSTHSPIILAASHLGGDSIEWCILKDYLVEKNKKVKLWNKEEIAEIGKLMGDSNFEIYFYTSQDRVLTFIEDKRLMTKTRFEDAGIKLTNCLDGITQVGKTIEVLLNTPELIHQKAYFIIDNDRGKEALSRYIPDNVAAQSGGFDKYKVNNSTKIFIITLPPGYAVEDLFDEFDNHVSNCVTKIWNTASWSIKLNIPSNLSRVCAKARSHTVDSILSAKELIKNEQDVKNLFWQLVEINNYRLIQQYIDNLKKLIN